MTAVDDNSPKSGYPKAKSIMQCDPPGLDALESCHVTNGPANVDPRLMPPKPPHMAPRGAGAVTRLVGWPAGLCNLTYEPEGVYGGCSPGTVSGRGFCTHGSVAVATPGSVVSLSALWSRGETDI